MDPKMEMAPRVRILRPPNEALYIYKAVSLASPDGREIAATPPDVGAAWLLCR